MKFLSFVFLLISLNYAVAQQPAFYQIYEQTDSSRKAFIHRYEAIAKTGFQHFYRSDSVIIKIHNVTSFAKAIKRRRDRIVFEDDNEAFVLKRKDIRKMLTEQYISTFESRSEKYKKDKTRYFRKVLKGKKRAPRRKEVLYLALAPSSLSREFTLLLNRGRRTHTKIDFKETTVEHFNEFPWFRNVPCTSFNRWTHFLYRDSYGPRSFGKLPFYSPVKVDRWKEKFVLLFRKNSTEYNQEAVDRIKDFLVSNNKGIAAMHINGFSSIEGDTLNNIKLQERRAEILAKSLEPFSEEALKYKLVAEENWKMFERQIKEYNLPELSRAGWKELLYNDSVQQKLEHLLSRQRRAEVTLYLFSIKSKEELLSDIVDDFKGLNIDYLSLPAKHPNRIKIVGHMLAIRNYLREKVVKGNFPVEYLQKLDHLAMVPEYFIYSLYSEMLSAKTISGQQEIMKELALKAYSAAMERFAEFPHNRFTQSDLLEVQKFIFTSIKNDYFEPDMMYDLHIPTDDKYANLALNHMDFKEHLITSGKLQPEMAPEKDDDFKIAWLDISSRYYYLLKKITLSALKDRNTTDHMLEFDMAYFLMLNSTYWHPLNNEYLDKEINFQKMNIILRKLLSIRKKICPYTLDMIMTDFYKKIIQEGSVRRIDEKLVQEAVIWLRYYYTKNNSLLHQEERKSLARQIIAANNYCYFNEAYDFAQWLLLDKEEPMLVDLELHDK